MKRQWTADDLAEHWTLSPDERALLANRAPATRLGFALLLKYFQHEGRFPRTSAMSRLPPSSMWRGNSICHPSAICAV